MSDGINNKQQMKAGDSHYRAFVGPPQRYDLVSAMQFNILTQIGLRESNTLLDIGCGSLRAGRLFIPYLKPRCYFGIEPEQWLIKDAVEHEIGQDLIDIKQPQFDYNDQFELGVFGQKFDYIIAQSIFTHATQEQIRKCLQSAKTVLNQDGLFLATFILGQENYPGDTWVYPGIVEYQLSFMQQQAHNAGLVCQLLDWNLGGNHRWLLIHHSDIFREIPYVTNRDYHALYMRLQNHPYVQMGLIGYRWFQALKKRFSYKLPK